MSLKDLTKHIFNHYAILAAAIFAIILGVAFTQTYTDGTLNGIGVELIGTGLTVIIIDILKEYQFKKASESKDKAELIIRMGSEDIGTALGAARMLRFKGWLYDGSLEWADLSHANLEKAFLDNANLKNVNFIGTRLHAAMLRGTNLEGANLAITNLAEAKYNEKTILPDGTTWIEGTDMDRFTKETHPNFWRSSDPKSSAYKDNRPRTAETQV